MDLFKQNKSDISCCIKNIFTEGELERNAVITKFATTAVDEKTYQIEFYNLVGYHVKSQHGVQFRIWAMEILKKYMRKGFALDNERLKNLGGVGYFKELLEHDKIEDAESLLIAARAKKQAIEAEKLTDNNIY